MNYLNFVNIKQGSKSTSRFSNGNTLPLVQMPFGMTAYAPETENNLNWYYYPESKSIQGIRLTHQPSPWIGDYGAVTFLPQSGKPCFDANRRWSGYRNQDSILTPAYMKLDLLRSQTRFELSPTQRCAVIRLNYNQTENNYFSVLPVKGECDFYFDNKKNTFYGAVKNVNSGEAENFCMRFIIKFPKDCVDVENCLTENITDEPEKAERISGNMVGIHLKLKSQKFEAKLATSYISFEQAELNLENEIGEKTFNIVKDEAEEVWESYLSRIVIETKDEKKLKTFYSCMYRAFLYPHKCYEYNKNGAAVHYCPHDGSVKNGTRYTDNGFWDTFRTVYSLYSLIAKEELKEMVSSFINEYKESGWLPRWLSIGEVGCMPSTLIDAVICDAAVKGFLSKSDLETALEGMIKHSNINSENEDFGRNGAQEYVKYGYVPYEVHKESVNLTLDAAYGDWCIAETAKLLKKADIEKEYRKRSLNYKNLFDCKSGFMRAKSFNGDFREAFNPCSWGLDYTEGSAWQNSFAVQHDIEGLSELYGSKEKLMLKIDELFNTKPVYYIGGYSAEIHEMTEMAVADFGQCAMSNQPSFHIPYIYSALGDVEKSAKIIEKLCNELFSFEDDGFPGDEDNGSMAAWYIFSILGFYPFCPGKKEFVKGKMQVDKMFINGKNIDVNEFSGNKIPYDELI